jgi:flavin-dependent dehydrogenase
MGAGSLMTQATWDVVVIGAGPAGSVAATLVARQGARVLLVERKAFPRAKVCGGCLNGVAVAVLDRVGLGARVRALGARPLSGITLHHGAREAHLAVPPGLAVTRAALDASLVAAAVEAGVVFAPETAALLMDEGADAAHDGWRQVALQPRHSPASIVRARVVLAADGLTHSSLRECGAFRSTLARNARVGIGSLCRAGAVSTRRGTITMAIGRSGYVGAVEVEDGRINVAAAVDACALKASGHPAAAIAAILEGARVPYEPGLLEDVEWTGTVPLTRRLPRPVSRRVFVLGDAAGYVEPFTGEGMAWAFAAAEAVAPLAAEAIAHWHDGLSAAWQSAYTRRVRREQRWCRVIASGLRVPPVVSIVIAALRHRPELARPVLAHLNPRPPES